MNCDRRHTMPCSSVYNAADDASSTIDLLGESFRSRRKQQHKSEEGRVSSGRIRLHDPVLVRVCK
jgi:hypothetical protein